MRPSGDDARGRRKAEYNQRLDSRLANRPAALGCAKGRTTLALRCINDANGTKRPYASRAARAAVFGELRPTAVTPSPYATNKANLIETLEDLQLEVSE